MSQGWEHKDVKEADLSLRSPRRTERWEDGDIDESRELRNGFEESEERRRLRV